MAESRNPKLKGAEVIRIQRPPSLTSSDRFPLSAGGDGRVWEAAFPPGYAKDPHDMWGLSGLPPVDWEQVVPATKATPRKGNPWSS